MRLSRFTHLLIFLLSCVFVFCGVQYHKAHAIADNSDTQPARTTVQHLQYADTTQPEYQILIRKLDSFYHHEIKLGFNGSVLIGREGKVIYERYFGVCNKKLGSRIRSNSACQLASVTKTFTSAAVLYLAQHNYLDLDEKVSYYLDGFPYEQITIRMLLNHRSGIPDYLKWAPRYIKSNAPVYNDELLKLFAKYKPALEFKPNTRFKYSNSNYALLASVIETVTDMKYADFMQRYIFEPLQMKNTFVYDPAKTFPVSTTISYNRSWVPEPDTYSDGIYGDKGIYSTVQDLYRWDQSFYNNILLSNETIEEAYGPCSFETPGIKNYGLGWRMLCYPSGNKIIYHNGWWHGNNTVFYRFIQENMTFIILGNRYNTRIYQQPKVIYSLIKGRPVSEGFDDEA